MEGQAWRGRHVERNQRHLYAVAYRILGSNADAQDAVQEAWLRFFRSDEEALDNPTGWLTTVVSRICLDILRSRTARREQLVDVWQRELADMADERAQPEQEALQADSVRLALRFVLRSLPASERVAFVLHDVFSVPFDEVAATVHRTPAATRQLASRARRRIRVLTPTPDAGTDEQAQASAAFLAAARTGDLAPLVGALDPQIASHPDPRPARRKK
jgi:RNA polymerase sigma factor (sigma-70 family)